MHPEQLNRNPHWLKAYNPSEVTLNNPEYHYYAKPTPGLQSVTVYPKGEDNTSSRPIKMYFEPLDITARIAVKPKKEERLKDFSGVEFLATGMSKIMVTSQNVKQESQWIRKYEPMHYFELLTDEIHNRNCLTWLKSWDEIVFNRKPPKVSAIPNLFTKFKPKNSSYVPIEYNYKKLLLLAGPPGCGKTTLARVIARHCGYAYQEINASEDRSGKALIARIEVLAKNKTIRADKKPICIIMDEVDGALDSDSNGLKDVLNYIEAGKTDKKKKAEPNQQKSKSTLKKNNHQQSTEDKQIPDDSTKSRLNRPIIFICNDPFVRGLKQLRSRAIVVYFNTLQEEKVIKRLKEVTSLQNQFVENQIVTRICSMCQNDVRSAIGVLELVCKQRATDKVSAKDALARINISLGKDSNCGINEFITEIMRPQGKKSSHVAIFTEYSQFVRECENHTLLFEQFFHNMIGGNGFFRNMGSVCQLYNELVDLDLNMKSAFKYNFETERVYHLPLVYYRLQFQNEQYRKIEFPVGFFEKITKQKTNQATLDKFLTGLPAHAMVSVNRRAAILEYLPALYSLMQTPSTREEDAINCAAIMLAYNFQLANRYSPNLFIPDIGSLLTFNSTHPEVLMSQSARALIEENYDFLKMKSLLVEGIEPSKMGEQVKAQLTRNRRHKRTLNKEVVKYKFLEGTGTEVKYDLKIGYFFNRP